MKHTKPFWDSKSFWGIVAIIGGIFTNDHFNWIQHEAAKGAILALWGWFMLYARNRAAESGKVLTLTKEVPDRGG